MQMIQRAPLRAAAIASAVATSAGTRTVAAQHHTPISDTRNRLLCYLNPIDKAGGYYHSTSSATMGARVIAR